MTCTLQMMKPVTMQDWKSVFPDFTTLTGSSQFIKKLMAVSLSAITYFRGVFPEKAYGERQLCGLKLKLLTEDSGIEGVNKFINLIRSCYDAVEKKYLNQLSIGICTDTEDRDNVVESYNMSFRYRNDEYFVENKSRSVNLTENDPIVEATFWLLKSIFTVSDILGPLPKKAFLTMKLLYNDEITPEDYQPPGFEPSDTVKFTFPSSAVKLELGKVSTDMHGYKMYLKTALSKEPLSQMLEESVLTDSQKSRDMIPPSDYDMPQENILGSEDIIQESQSKLEKTDEICCPCTCKQEKGTNILICSICERKQHSICYGILEPEEYKSEFHCIQCINETPFRSSQEDLIYTYEGKDQQELAALRRALVFCASIKHVTQVQLEKQLQCNKPLAKDLIERLEFEGFIKKTGIRHKFTVNEKKIINNGYQQYFFRAENKENAKISQKTRLSQENSKLGMNNELLSEDHLMDFAIDKEVEKLNLKGPFENLPKRNLRAKRSLPAQASSDSEEASQNQSKKKRCMRTKEKVLLY